MEQKKKNKYLIIGGVIALLAVVGTFFNYGQNPTVQPASPTVEQSAPAEDNIQPEESTEAEPDEHAFAKDPVVDEFVVAYNAIAAHPFTELEVGNIRTKYFGASGGYEFEMLNANDTENILVTINTTPETLKADASAMATVFHDAVKAIDPSLSDEEIAAHFNSFITLEYSGKQDLGKMEVEFHPTSAVNRNWFAIAAKPR